MTKMSSSVQKAHTKARSKTAMKIRRSFVNGSLFPNAYSSIYDLAKMGKLANTIEWITQKLNSLRRVASAQVPGRTIGKGSTFNRTIPCNINGIPQQANRFYL